MWQETEKNWIPLTLKAENLLYPNYTVNFWEQDLYFLEKIPSDEQIDINSYANKFKESNSIQDYLKLYNYLNQIDNNISLVKIYAEYLHKLQNQRAVITEIMANIDQQKIFAILSNYTEFTKLAEYTDFEKVPIEFIPPVIPHLYQFCLSSILNMNMNCSVLLHICNNVAKNKPELLIDIFTEEFNKKFINNVKLIINKYAIQEIMIFLSTTTIGHIINSESTLKQMFDEYYNSLMLLEQL